MHRILFCFSFFHLFYLSLCGCETESPLSDVELNDPLQIKAIRYVKTGEGNVVPKDKTVAITSPELGQYTFDPAYFQDVDGNVINVDFVLISIEFGSIEGSFKSDSYIKNAYEIWKSVNVR